MQLRKPPIPALTVKLSKYNVDDVALGFCKTGAEEAGVTEVFFFNDTATTEIYPLSLHDALPISRRSATGRAARPRATRRARCSGRAAPTCRDRKSTRLNSSHGYISYAVFCLKKKNITISTV